MAEKSQRGSNLSQADRERGGRASAAKQVRDARGQFAGTQGGKAAGPPDKQREEDRQEQAAASTENRHGNRTNSSHSNHKPS